MWDEKVTPRWPNTAPDFNRLLAAVTRRGIPDRVPFIELFADREIMAAVLGENIIQPAERDREAMEDLLRQRIRFNLALGYDYVTAGPALNLNISRLSTEDTAGELGRAERHWQDEARGLVETTEDFERYPWPAPADTDYSGLEFVAEHLPEGMRVIGVTVGVLELVMWLMGFVPFSMALYDQPRLIHALFDKVEELLVPAYETMASMPEVGAVFLGDDMGYRSGTFIRPEQMRQYVFPIQKKLVQIAHRHGKPFLLHACGNLEAIMDDLIDSVGIDGKHSFEDTFLPVTEAKRLYGGRISILGGVDVDMMCRSTEDEVRAYTRRVLEACMPGGGYALGTGNSVANYIPVRNYLAMLDEGMKVGWYAS